MNLRENVRDAIAESLGDAYDCLRVWSAWSVGTMTEDDFHLITDDESRLLEITDAALFAMDFARIDQLEACVAKCEAALDKLARLGNGDHYGTSDGNRIAQAALAELNKVKNG